MAGKKNIVKQAETTLVVAASDQQLDEAVAHINHLYVAKGLETARDIGEYVLNTFFGGDSAAFQTRGNGHETFRKLAEHPGLQVSYSFIYNSVAVFEQLKALPADIASALPLSHHKILLPVKDQERKVELARLAVEGNLPKAKFAEVVSKQRKASAEGAARGRPALPAFVKVLGPLKQICDDLPESIEDDSALQNYTLKRAMECLDVAAEQAEEILRKIARLREGMPAAVT